MDDRGRLTRPLTRDGPGRDSSAGFGSCLRAPQRTLRADRRHPGPMQRRALRFVAVAGVFAVLVASAGYVLSRSDNLSAVSASMRSVRDTLASAVGFRIAAISIAGQQRVSREDIIGMLGISETTSLLFYDVEGARARLKQNPWIAEATVRKLFPDRIEVTVEERQPFALWQAERKVTVIAADGTVLSREADARSAHLPFLVGAGAQMKARSFIGLLDRFPDIRDQVRASILVADRRWNLRLHNGLDVRLPETEIEIALGLLSQLDRERKLLSRDIVSIDLRLPDRVTVRLSEDAARSREEASKEKKGKRKGGDA